MGKILFSIRELTKAWKEARVAAGSPPKSNAHRLLLFYSVECGLKAAHLKRSNKTILDAETADQIGHDINKALDLLRAGAELKLPLTLDLNSLSTPPPNPKAILRANNRVDTLNQIWRYGGTLTAPTDADIALKLVAINNWIEREI